MDDLPLISHLYYNFVKLITDTAVLITVAMSNVLVYVIDHHYSLCYQ